MAKVIIFSGAGISSESGISTFRDSGGLWEEYDIEVVCYYDSLDNNEAITIEFYDKRRAELIDKEPNKAHIEVAKLKAKYPKDISIITQNVDNLFEKAGLDDVIHLHGFMTELRCRECDNVWDIGYAPSSSSYDGKCPSCGAKSRPNIVFFGEQAPQYEKLNQELQDCEYFVVIGTSGNVIGVNTIANAVENSILNNLEPSDAIEDELFKKVIYAKASDAIEEIVLDIEGYLE